MTETPLLPIDGPALVFGGPYGNLQATAAVLAQAERLGIPPSRIICTGDLVAYCGDPVATIALVRRSGIHVVMGNCDEQLAQGAPDCGCGYPSGSACERLSSAWFAHADARVGRDARLWLAGLPRRIDLRIGGRRLAVVHGSASRINQFVFASTAAAIKRRELDWPAPTASSAAIAGCRSARPSTAGSGTMPGVVGMPAHDGTPRVWYSVLTPASGGLADRALRARLRPRRGRRRDARAPACRPTTATALASGLWPSCDVLPYREIARKRGRDRAGLGAVGAGRPCAAAASTTRGAAAFVAVERAPQRSAARRRQVQGPAAHRQRRAARQRRPQAASTRCGSTPARCATSRAATATSSRARATTGSPI